MLFEFCVFLILYGLTKQLLINKLNNYPPSPLFTLPFIGHLHLLKRPAHRSLTSLCTTRTTKHGGGATTTSPILLLQLGSRRALLVSSPSAAEECLTKNDVTFANHPRLLAGKHLGYNYKSLMWTPYGDHWRNLRRICSLELLSTHRLRALSKMRHEEVRSMVVKRLVFNSSTCGKNNDLVVNVKETVFEMLLNVVMRMVAGKRYYGHEDDGVVSVEARRFREIVMESALVGGNQYLVDYLPVFGLFFRGVERRLSELQKRRDGFVQDLVEEHRAKMAAAAGGGETKTLIEVLLSLQESEPEYYTDEIIRGLMLTLFTTGVETAACTIEWAMALLLNNPEILSKAREEIDTVIGISNRLIEESDIPNLPFLNCIITETFRMYPVGPLIPHESKEECTVGGYRVPSGTMLLINLWAIQNDPLIWENPTKFKPDRFEGANIEVRDGFKLMPFGSGRRACPGEGLALKLIGLTLGSMIQCFDWDRVGQEMVDMSDVCGITLTMARPLVAKCIPREFVKSFI